MYHVDYSISIDPLHVHVDLDLMDPVLVLVLDGRGRMEDTCKHVDEHGVVLEARRGIGRPCDCDCDCDDEVYDCDCDCDDYCDDCDVLCDAVNGCCGLASMMRMVGSCL